MKTLLLLRHAKSSRTAPVRNDHERPLNTRGQRDAPRIGDLVREQGLTPQVIISSDAVRARVTAEAVAMSTRYAGELVLEPRLYLASPAAIVAVLRTVPEKAETVLVVGHNPGLEDLVAQLTGQQEDLPTATLAQIALPIAEWRELRVSTRGRLLALWRPAD